MPAHRFHGALLNLFLEDQEPWGRPQWQDITGIQHGLFPADDSQLPQGLTRDDANSLKSFFDQYKLIEKEDDRIKFASGRGKKAAVVGRGLWLAFTTSLWKKANLHNLIVTALRTAEVHPAELYSLSKKDCFPFSGSYVPLAIDDVGMALFGMEALDASNHIPAHLRGGLHCFIMRSWDAVKAQITTAQTKLPGLQTKATDAILGKTTCLFYLSISHHLSLQH